MNNTTIDELNKRVANRLKIPLEAMMSRSRRREHCFARQLSMYILRAESPLTLAEIGTAFNRDHTTVLFALQAVNEELKKKWILYTLIDLIEEFKEIEYTYGPPMIIPNYRIPVTVPLDLEDYCFEPNYITA